MNLKRITAFFTQGVFFVFSAVLTAVQTGFADVPTCIVGGWPVTENVSSAAAESTTPIVLGVCRGFEAVGDIDLNRRTCDISEGIGIDARDFTPGLILIVR